MRSIAARMGEAKAKMIATARVPRAFYLGKGDFAAFMATNPEEAECLFRCKPRLEPTFEGCAVRAASGLDQKGKSRLFSNYGVSVQVPVA